VLNLSPDIGLKFKEARKAKGLNQSALAHAMGCMQSAISMFEGGMTTKLSDETVQKMASFLGVSLETQPEKVEVDESVPVLALNSVASVIVRGYCPNGHCYSNVPYAIDGRLFYRPSRAVATPTGGKYCAVCGELLEMRCPVCGAPLNEGACCAVCGSAYVTPVLPEGTDAAAYARARRAEIAELYGPNV